MIVGPSVRPGVCDWHQEVGVWISSGHVKTVKKPRGDRFAEYNELKIIRKSTESTRLFIRTVTAAPCTATWLLNGFRRSRTLSMRLLAWGLFCFWVREDVEGSDCARQTVICPWPIHCRTIAFFYRGAREPFTAVADPNSIWSEKSRVTYGKSKLTSARTYEPVRVICTYIVIAWHRGLVSTAYAYGEKKKPNEIRF